MCCKYPAACKPEEFRCENGGCIELSRLCDYIPDCEGGEDEANCSTSDALIERKGKKNFHPFAKEGTVPKV